ncbi:hypothetical protein T4A_11505 [Trichinella pseudospiralis]|uniref:Uncharacterized protein n=1 Tax=Trichinella pseudospiralis TaxID=6337 RepID=A0A0V1EYC6_TRIPS|nr:hypothetical protein T4A_11505 [Trichinella pseudospiralis]
MRRFIYPRKIGGGVCALKFPDFLLPLADMGFSKQSLKQFVRFSCFLFCIFFIALGKMHSVGGQLVSFVVVVVVGGGGGGGGLATPPPPPPPPPNYHYYLHRSVVHFSFSSSLAGILTYSHAHYILFNVGCAN